MKSEHYLALNHWLQRADHNYLGGRVLWFSGMVQEACNLFWLSIEQALKILVFQDNIAEICSNCKNLDEVYEVLKKKGTAYYYLRI